MINKIHIQGLLLVFLYFFLIACQQNKVIRMTEFALGTPLSIQIFNGGSKKDAQAVFDEIKTIEALMSTSTKDYDTSELLDINALSIERGKTSNKAFEYPVSASTKQVLIKSLEIAEKTSGAFDPTIAPLVSLWGFGTETLQVPSIRDINKTLPLISWQNLSVLSNDAITLAAGQSLDVGGIAKGYASDVAAKMLKAAGVSHAIIDFGGNIRTIGETKMDGSLWKIGIQEPFADMGSILGFVKIGESSVVTSGVYERTFEEDGIQYFHLLDASTGYPARNGLVSVSIIKTSGIEADGLSTGLFVLGLEKGLALANRLKDTEALFVTDTNEIFISDGLLDVFEITSDNYRFGTAFQK